MSQIISVMISLLLCVLEIYMLSIFMNIFFLKKSGKERWFWCFIVAVCIQYSIVFLDKLWLCFIALPVLYFVFSILVYEITAKKAIMYTLTFYIVFVYGREAAFAILYRFLYEAFPSIEIMFSAIEISLYLPAYLSSLLILLYLRKYMKEIKTRDVSGLAWYLVVMPLSSVLILLSFLYLDFPSKNYLRILMCCSAFLLYFSNAVVFIIWANYAQAMKRIKAAELSLLKNDMEKKNIDDVIKINDIYREHMHDIHRYFFQFKNLALSGENETIVNIIDSWENNLKQEESNRLYTDSAVVNSLLSGCYDHAKERQIEIDIFVDDALPLDFIQDVDKISMFGNLLDNAVEAAEKCEEGSRKIDIQMYMGNKYFLVFRIKNTWVKKLRRDGERLLSTKKDFKNHGFGTAISRDLAKKYGGSLEWEEKGDWFITTLTIAVN